MAITINTQSNDFTEVEQYLMTLDRGIKSLTNIEDNTSIPVAGYLTFTDEKENGDSVDILSIITPDNEVFSCQSATFKRSFDNIYNIMHGKQFSVIKVSGTTKAGRPYIDCALDVKSVK
nr:MAG: Single-stranded DNA-binding protein [Bacteriophage sp.]